MGILKEFTVDLYEVFSKVASDCDLDSSTVRYCLHRLRNEGLKFWTVTLPKLAKVVLYSIEAGCFQQAQFTEIAWQGRSLRYFRSLLGKIFCLKTGELLAAPSGAALASLRQLLEYVYKLSLGFDNDARRAARVKYEQIQKRVADTRYDHRWMEILRCNAETHYKPLFKGSPDSILKAGPRFGPGSFSTVDIKLKHKPHVWKQLPDSIIGTCASNMRPYSGYFKPYPGCPGRVRIVPTHKVTQVHYVPKDSRGPRIISAEPPHLIKPQMAFFAHVSKALEVCTSYRINFRDQSLNKRLACESSVSRENATIDLKDASDMVSHRLIRYIFSENSPVKWFIDNCRSLEYRAPCDIAAQGSNGSRGKIHSLAGMGSGLTFPLLAFLVHLSVCSSVCSTLRLDYQNVSKRVYVYGDDLIVPIDWVEAAYSGLQASGLVVNSDKSYSKGPFRESCGGDYLNGVECAPVRLKLTGAGIPAGVNPASYSKGASRSLHIRSANVANPNGFVVSLAKHTHELRKGGLNNTADYFERLLERVIPMPYVGQGSPCLGKYTEDTNKIVMQGKQDSTGQGDTVIKVCQPLPFVAKSHEVCPYKYLGDFLRSNTTDEDSSLSRVFGEVPTPRVQRLIFRKIRTTVVLPRTAEVL